MCKTEFTVGEWRPCARAVGFPEWGQSGPNWKQTDEHPLVNVSLEQAQKLCLCLSGKTQRERRLPTHRVKMRAGNMVERMNQELKR